MSDIPPPPPPPRGDPVPPLPPTGVPVAPPPPVGTSVTMPSSEVAGGGIQATLTPVRLEPEGFGVNLLHMNPAAASELLGEGSVDGDKQATCVVFRDPTSSYPDSIRVETLHGVLVGWILKSESKVVGQILDQATKSLRKSNPKLSLRKHSFAFHVPCVIKGEVYEGRATVENVWIELPGSVAVTPL